MSQQLIKYEGYYLVMMIMIGLIRRCLKKDLEDSRIHKYDKSFLLYFLPSYRIRLTTYQKVRCTIVFMRSMNAKLTEIFLEAIYYKFYDSDDSVPAKRSASCSRRMKMVMYQTYVNISKDNWILPDEIQLNRNYIKTSIYRASPGKSNMQVTSNRTVNHGAGKRDRHFLLLPNWPYTANAAKLASIAIRIYHDFRKFPILRA
jgi:hypothetical protein